MTWQGQDCTLILHHDNGFTMTEKQSGDDGNSGKSQILWHYPYEKLRMSADDGMRILWLDFGEEGEQVRVTQRSHRSHRDHMGVTEVT